MQKILLDSISRALSGCLIDRHRHGRMVGECGGDEIAGQSRCRHAQIPFPRRTAVDAYFAHLRAMGVQRHLDVTFDSTWASWSWATKWWSGASNAAPARRCCTRVRPGGARARTPGQGPFSWYWMVSASDDTGTSTTTTTPAGSIFRAQGRTERCANRTLVRAPRSLSDYSSPSAGGWRPHSSHIESSWVTRGMKVGQATLGFGADDMGSVMIVENVVSVAGSTYRTRTDEFLHLIRA